MNVHIMKVTIKEIARKTGFSINTVSRALKDMDDVQTSTKERIKRAAHELRYIPNTLAGSLRSKKTNILGIISSDSSNPYFAEVILGIEEGARNNGYHILLINTEEERTQQEEALGILLSRQVDGLLIVPVGGSTADEFRHIQKPFILVGRWLAGLKDHAVLTNDVANSRKIVQHLIQNGHKDILFLTGPPAISSSIDRIEGSKIALQEEGLEMRKELIMETDGHLYGGHRAISKALQRGVHFTAVSAFNDLVAIGAIRALKEQGLKVPDDIEIIGYDNLNISQFTFQSLSTVDIPKHKLGVASVEELIKHIEDPSYPYRELLLEARLIIRETTKNIPIGGF